MFVSHGKAVTENHWRMSASEIEKGYIISQWFLFLVDSIGGVIWVAA